MLTTSDPGDTATAGVVRRGRLRAPELMAALPLLAALAAIAAYGVLLPAGRWQGDDYLGGYFVAHHKWATLFGSLRWAPRLLAQPLAWAYAAASNYADRPLVSDVLAVVWGASLGGVAAAAAVGRLRRPVQAAAVLFALTLLLIKPGEMFYWPIGALAYLPCWAGLAGATVLHRSDVSRHFVALSLCLLVATLSLEMGAATVVIYAALAGAAAVRTGLKRWMLALVLPGICAAGVCGAVLVGRMQPMREVMDPTSGLAGHWLASARAALPQFWLESVGLAGAPLVAGLAGKLALVFCLAPDGGDRRAARAPVLLWSLALLLGAFLSIVLAYHQFGTLCCERHATLRQGMVLMALASFAGLLGNAWPVARSAGLAVLILGLLGFRSGALYADWRSIPQVVQARQRSWDSGRGPGDKMTLVCAPPGRITNGDALPYGSYERKSDVFGGDGAWFAWGIMARFHKHALVIEPMGKDGRN